MGDELNAGILPRWRLTRWLADPGEQVPGYIRGAMIGSLYGSIPIFLGGVFNTVAVSSIVAARNPSVWFFTWAAIELLLAAARLPVLVAGRRAVAAGGQAPTDLYIVLGLLWAASVGFGCFLCLRSGDWVSATLACLSAGAMVGGICLRNFAAPRLAAAMIVLSLGPCAAAGFISGEPILFVSAFQIPLYLFSMASASFHLSKMLVRTMQAERENDYRARHDALTGILNRDGLERALAARFARGQFEDDRLSLFYLDLDGFKQVNDSLGHAAGDRLLRLVASRLESLMRPDDVVARIGGDEFVILSQDSGRAGAARYGDSIVRSVAEPYLLGERAVFVGVSVGVALSHEHGGELQQLLNAADLALYQAKSGGRSRCVVASDPAAAPAPVLSGGRREWEQRSAA